MSGKYCPKSDGTIEGAGRFQEMTKAGWPTNKRFSESARATVEAVGAVANEQGRSMPQVALNWVANRPGVASVLVGVAKLEQLTDNLSALDFTIPQELMERLDTASACEPRFPYTFFLPRSQRMLSGGLPTSGKPPGYWAENSAG